MTAYIIWLKQGSCIHGTFNDDQETYAKQALTESGTGGKIEIKDTDGSLFIDPADITAIAFNAPTENKCVKGFSR